MKLNVTKTSQPRDAFYMRNDDGGGWRDINRETFDSRLIVEEYDGNVTPNFGQRVRAGELIPHQLYHKRSLIVDGYTEFQTRSTDKEAGKNDSYRISSIPYLDKPSITDPTANYDALLQIAAKRIYSDSHDTLTFLAELGKVRTQFINLPNRIISIAKSLGVRDVRELASAWLEYRYAWRTLWFDMQDISKALNKLGKPQRPISTAFQSVELSTSESNVERHKLYVSSYLTGWGWVKTSQSSRLSAKGVLSVQFRPPSFQFDILQTSWELIPWSFVIDWFFTVGAVINQVSLIASSDGYAASSGFKLEREETRVATKSEGHANYSCDYFKYDYTSKEVILNRTPRGLKYTPQISVNLDKLKVIDIIALIKQAL